MMHNPSMLFYKLYLDLQAYLSDEWNSILMDRFSQSPPLSFSSLELEEDLLGCWKRCFMYIDAILVGLNVSFDVRSTEVRAAVMLTETFKKFQVDTENVSANVAALMKFLAVNKRAGKWNYERMIKRAGYRNHTFVEPIFNLMRFELHKALVMSDEGMYFENVKRYLNCGPGKSSGCDGFDFFTKLFQSVTCSSLDLYRGYCTMIYDTVWGFAEERRRLQFGLPIIIDYCSMFFAPKNYKISRPAGTEPVLNMVIQKAISGVFEKVLLMYFGINIQFQQLVNREMARIGSIDGSFDTLDLVSSSDLIALLLCKGLFPQQAFEWMLYSRSRRIKLPSELLEVAKKSDKDAKFPKGNLLHLNMMSTMGNGFTFSMQTLIFVVLVKCVYNYLDIPFVKTILSTDKVTGVVSIKRLGNYSVFGDDIIVVPQATGLVMKMLDALGLEVNEIKSCYSGYFRESCGSDQYFGFNVRPVYIKGLNTLQERFIAFNTTLEWSALNNTPLPRFTNAILDMIPKKDRLWVPRLETEDAGLRCPEPYLPIRFLRHFQYKGFWLYEKYVPIGEGRKTEKVEFKGQKVEVDGYTYWSGRKTLTDITYDSYIYGNPYGYLCSALRGDISGGFYSFRASADCDKGYSKQLDSSYSWDGCSSYFEDKSRVLVLRTLDECLGQLGRSRQSSFKRLFDIYELNM